MPTARRKSHAINRWQYFDTILIMHANVCTDHNSILQYLQQYLAIHNFLFFVSIATELCKFVLIIWVEAIFALFDPDMGKYVDYQFEWVSVLNLIPELTNQTDFGHMYDNLFISVHVISLFYLIFNHYYFDYTIKVGSNAWLYKARI